MIGENLKNVEENITNACERVNRNREDVTLIAVSKTKPVELLKSAYDLGCRDFGENKVQEMLDKIDVLPKDIRWHMIGHLQTNKVKYIVDKVAMIHSVDSLHLAKEISKEAVKKNCITNILIEINVAGEASKFGTSDWDTNYDLIRTISLLPNLHLCGLMTIAPYTEHPEENRIYFQQLKDFLKNRVSEFFPTTPYLSMGMTGDYVIAVEEGATHVRVGTGIFGERNYHLNTTEN